MVPGILVFKGFAKGWIFMPSCMVFFDVGNNHGKYENTPHIISKAKEDQRENGWAKGLTKGLDSHAFLHGLFVDCGPPQTKS